MAAVGTLTIEMAANVARLAQDMQKATKTVDGAMSKIQRSVDVARTAIVGLAGVLTIRQFSSFIKSSAAASEQLERMAFLANTSVASFQRMSLASDRFGISQEKLGDILKDTQDKVGDFMQTGGGAMADFFENIAPKVGVTAEQFRKLNGRDALQLYVSSLEKANLSQSDMVFYMEAIASDSTLLLPLLRENGKAFQEIAIQAEKFGAVMDDRTIAASKDLNANLHSMNNFMDGIGISIYSALLPGLNAISDSFIKFAESSRIAQYAASAVLIIFQTLTVVGSDLIFVIDQVVKGLVALVQAQYKLLSGNFSGAIKVFEEYNAQARDARTALDELQAEIMGLGKESDNAEKSVNGLSGSLGSGVKAATDLENAYDALVKTLRSDITKSTAELQAEQQGLNNAQTDFLELVSGNDWKQYTAAQKMLITDLYKQRIETEQLIDAEKKRAKAAEARLKKMLDDEKEFMDELKKEDEKRAADKLKKEKEFFEEQKKQIQQIEDQLTDALMRAFESGKGFGQAFKDTLVNMFRTMVLRPILAPISGAFAGAFGTSGAMAAGAGGMSGTTGLLGGIAAASGALGTGIAAGFTNALSLNFAGSLQAAGSLIGTGAMSGIAAGVGMIAGTILPIVGAVSLIKSLTGGDGKDPTGMGAFVTTRGVNIDRELVAATTGFKISSNVVGDFFDRANEQIKPAVQTIVDGILDRTQDRARAIGLDIALGIDAGLVADPAAKSSFGYASVFIGNQEVENFVNRRLGPDFEKATVAFTEQLQESIAKAVLDAGNIVIPAGQTATAVLERLGSSILAVNNTFETLGLSLYETSIAGAEMAAALVDLLGGVENFTQLSAQYYQNFYTEAERTQILMNQLAGSFGDLGLSLPGTREAFRAIVEAQDLSTESGRELFAALMMLSPAFNEFINGAESSLQQAIAVADEQRTRMEAIQAEQAAAFAQQIQTAFNDANTATNVALSAVQRAIDAQKESLELSAEIAEEQVDSIQSVFDVLNSAILDLTGGGFTAITGQAFIQQALLAAQTSGYLPDPNELSRAISAVRGGLTGGSFGSAFEARREQALFVARLTQLREFAGDQLSTAEQTLNGINLQIAQLDEQLIAAQEQVNVLRGIDTGIRDIPTSIAALQTSISNELTALRELQAQQARVAAPVVTPTAIPTPTPSISLNTAGLSQMGPFPPNYGPGIGQTGSNSITINRPAGQTGSSQTITIGGQKVDVLTLNPSGLRGFAAGGLHSGGMRMVGERGPELEMTGPARYMSNANLASLMGNNSNEEVKQLREENRVQLRAMVSLQNRMTKVIEQWNGDGLPTERVEA
jgi:trimeric autotransporter adhesin